MSKKKMRFAISPELNDGEHWAVVDTLNDVLQAITDWYGNDPDPLSEDGFSVKVVLLTDKEVDAMPEC